MGQDWRAMAVLGWAMLVVGAPVWAERVIDNDSPGFAIVGGSWAQERRAEAYGPSIRLATLSPQGEAEVRWTFNGVTPGRYYLDAWIVDGDHADEVTYVIESADGIERVSLSQHWMGDGWRRLGAFVLGWETTVRLTNLARGPGASVVADAMRLTPVEPLPDLYEPDDSPETASRIRPGAVQHRSLWPPGDVDWVWFDLDEPAAVRVRARPCLWLYDKALNQLAFAGGDGPARLRSNTLPPGRYYLRVEACLEEVGPSYTLSLELLGLGDVEPYITLVIDDAGYGHPEAAGPTRDLLLLPDDFHYTLAILPRLAHTRRTAAAWDAAGRDYILHQPMEPRGYPAMDPGPGAILLDTPKDRVAEILAQNLDQLHQPSGANNHMGSAVSQDAATMALVFEELGQRDLYYMDSWTTNRSVGYRTAQALGLPAAVNTLFVDGGGALESVSLILGLAQSALLEPNLPHIAIGHVRRGTVDAMALAAPTLAEMGVETRGLRDSVGIVIEVDDPPQGMDVERSGNWTPTNDDVVFSAFGTARSETRDGLAYLVPDCASSRVDSVTFTPNLPWRASYDVYLLAGGDEHNCSHVNVTLRTLQGTQRLVWDQRIRPRRWFYLGRFDLDAGRHARLTLDDFDATTPGETFHADAVKFIHAGPVSQSPGLHMAHRTRVD